MALTDMKVYSSYIADTAIETLSQMVDAFNAASGGSIVLTTAGFDGDFMRESFFAGLHAAQRRVDRYAAQASASATDLSQLDRVGVKVAGGFGPIRMEPGQLTWMQQNPEAGIEAASRNMAEAIVADQLNSAVAASVAAIGNVAALVNDVSAGSSGAGALTYAAFNGAHAKFGDRSSAIVAHVVNGVGYHKLIGQNLSNANRLFQAGNVQVVDILGRVVVVTDAPALEDTSGTPDLIYGIGLVQGGVTVYDGSDLIVNIDQTNGQTRIETTMQADYTFGLALKGYAWDTANGGKSPTDAEIATGTNWDQVATSTKDTAGVLVIADSAQ